MGRWKKTEVQRPPASKIEVEGTFSCQFCGEYTDVAYYLPEVTSITWKCEGCDKISIVTEVML